MKFKLGRNVQAGDMIKTNDGMLKIESVDDIGAYTKKGFIRFGEVVLGWKGKRKKK